MENLQQYPGVPGIFFSGIIWAALSTISSLLNSISAIIMANFIPGLSKRNDECATVICKILVVVFGGIMFLGVVIVDNYHNVQQAVLTFLSVTCGPVLALYCIGICCPQANHKSVAISFSVSILFGLWVIVGTVMTSSIDIPLPFANCTSIRPLNTTENLMANLTESISNSNSDVYFPLAKVSYYYICLEGFAVTILCFLMLIIPLGPQQGLDGRLVSEMNLDLIPHCIKVVQLKMSRRMRRLFLCDVYGDIGEDSIQHLIGFNAISVNKDQQFK